MFHTKRPSGVLFDLDRGQEEKSGIFILPAQDLGEGACLFNLRVRRSQPPIAQMI